LQVGELPLYVSTGTANFNISSGFNISLIIRVMKSRRMRGAGHVARMREKRSACRILVGRPEGRRLVGTPRRRWDNIKMDLQEEGWGIDWSVLAQDRDRWRALVNAVMKLWFP
jgi:hypothetical protein